MTKPSFFGWYSLAVIAVAVLLLTGCRKYGEVDQVTPTVGIEVATGGYEIDLNLIDDTWLSEVECWEAVTGKVMPLALPDINILNPHENGRCDKIRVAWYDELVYGHLYRNDAFLPPDMCALRHELAHFISGELRGGNRGENGEGVCGLK